MDEQSAPNGMANRNETVKESKKFKNYELVKRWISDSNFAEYSFCADCVGRTTDHISCSDCKRFDYLENDQNYENWRSKLVASKSMASARDNFDDEADTESSSSKYDFSSAMMNTFKMIERHCLCLTAPFVGYMDEPLILDDLYKKASIHGGVTDGNDEFEKFRDRLLEAMDTTYVRPNTQYDVTEAARKAESSEAEDSMKDILKFALSAMCYKTFDYLAIDQEKRVGGFPDDILHGNVGLVLRSKFIADSAPDKRRRLTKDIQCKDSEDFFDMVRVLFEMKRRSTFDVAPGNRQITAALGRLCTEILTQRGVTLHRPLQYGDSEALVEEPGNEPGAGSTTAKKRRIEQDKKKPGGKLYGVYTDLKTFEFFVIDVKDETTIKQITVDGALSVTLPDRDQDSFENDLKILYAVLYYILNDANSFLKKRFSDRPNERVKGLVPDY